MLVSLWNALICRYQNNSNKLVSDCFRGFFAHLIFFETKFDLYPLSYIRHDHIVELSLMTGGDEVFGVVGPVIRVRHKFT